MAVPNLQFFSPIQATRSRGAVVKIATSSENITGPIQSSVETTMNFDLMKEQTVVHLSDSNFVATNDTELLGTGEERVGGNQ